MIKRNLESLLKALKSLNVNRTTLVIPDKANRALILMQVDGTKYYINNLAGLFDVYLHKCILIPDDLIWLIDSLDYVLSNIDTQDVLIAPAKMGFDFYVRGDVLYTSKPKLLFKMRLYSISNRFLVFLARIRSEEIRALWRRAKNV